MAVSNFRALQAFVAGVDLSTAYAMAVKIDTTGKVVLATEASGSIGIVIEANPLDDVVGVCTEQGVRLPARVSEAIPTGGRVTVAADGRFKHGASGDVCVGVATEAATEADQIITILYTPAGTVA